MKKGLFIILLLLTLISLNLFAEDYPIIFLHGNKAEGNYVNGWLTWGDHTMSPLNLIDAIQYKGYRKYEFDCNKYSQLPILPSKTMFNFSYYLTENEHGVISISNETAPVGFRKIVDENTHTMIDVAFPLFIIMAS
ncbi:MAG: hypothetical protein AB7T10_03085 [bacterium]